MPSINNDQTIVRVCPKMSEDFYDENNAKLSNKCINSAEYFDESTNNSSEIESEEENIPIISISNHAFPTQSLPAQNGEVTSSDATCQTAESEVNSIKKWLLLHNDLIQQQNEEILEKERQIFLLQKENEMLKERLKCLEKGVPFQTETSFNECVHEIHSEGTISEDMTQDYKQCEESSKENEVNLPQCDDSVPSSLEVVNYTDNLSDIESPLNTIIKDSFPSEQSDLKSEDHIVGDNFSDSFNIEGDTVQCVDSIVEYNFTVNHFSEELDPMKNIRMSIRRKRVCSNSSAVSNNEPGAVEERSFRRIKKKRKRSAKDVEILTTPEPYETQANEVNLGLPCPEIDSLDIDVTANTTLEVPRWRVKLYASCYTMEGTENIDDEVYHKRHMRLEIDERRRKRWDVQRIREQRVIEKLKQRQEKISMGIKGENQETPDSLWPKMEDIRHLEVADELPVSAFGYPIPKLPPSDFEIPWLNNPCALRKPQGKKSSRRRKISKSKR